ncbi:hypothetical protein [Paraburkholderia phenoliruptrix]|uniref:hypothetical protein n=1 Tax=Paraburkholderia phenoliruptrix TaxID=252970 RepID=UPI001CB7790D|nr:hypothetical protein [Paraburkholderia phenoliruptrix]
MSIRKHIKAAIKSLVLRAIDSGDIRAELERLHLLSALVGVSNVASFSRLAAKREATD